MTEIGRPGSQVSVMIAARMGSSRFPGKTLADLHGKPMLARLVERARASRYVGDVFVATSAAAEDDAIDSWCRESGIGCYRGSADDVLGRLSAAASHFEAPAVVEVLGDNPLVHSELIDACVELFESSGDDYVATVTNEYPRADPALRRFPIGVRVQVMRTDALRRCADMATEPRHREHATSFIAEHPELFATSFVEAVGDLASCHRPELTFAVNHRQNLDLVRKIFASCHPVDENFSLPAAITTFDSHSEWRPLMGNP